MRREPRGGSTLNPQRIAVLGGALVIFGFSCSEHVATSPLPTQLVLTTYAAGAESGASFTTQPVVAVRDAAGNTIATNAITVTMALIGDGIVVGNPTATTVNGVATFATVGIRGAGTYTLTFTAPGLNPATQSIVVTVGPPSQVFLTVSAAGAVSGAAFTTQPVVAVHDGQCNTVVTDNTSVVTMIVSAGGAVVGSATATVRNGVAAYTNVGIIGTADTSYTLTFASGTLGTAKQTITLRATGAPPVLTTVTIVWSTSKPRDCLGRRLIVGETVQLVARLLDQFGAAVTADSVAWSTFNLTGPPSFSTPRMSISSAGLATALSHGTAAILLCATSGTVRVCVTEWVEVADPPVLR